jgi:Winged helix-turn helix
MLRVDYGRWGQTVEDLRQLATRAPHRRTRERFLALYEIAEDSGATRVASRTRRHPQTVMGWVHLYNASGPEALTYRRTGGRRPFFARTIRPNSARPSAPPSERRQRRP